MEKEKMPFHLTITDNETGETLRDLDFDAIAGAVHISEEEAAGIFLTCCTNFDIAATIVAAENTLRRVEQEDPMLRLAKLMVGTKPGTEEKAN